MTIMIRCWTAALLTMLSTGLPINAARADFTIRFGTFNLHSDDLQKNQANFESLLHKWGQTFLRSADVVMLEELTQPSKRPHDQKFLDILATESGLTNRYAAYGPFPDDLDFTFPNVGVISRYPFVDGQEAKSFSGAKVLRAMIKGPAGELITLYGLRLRPNENGQDRSKDRADAAKSLADYINHGSRLFLILGGDFNSGMTETPYKTLTGNPTVPLSDALALATPYPTSCPPGEGIDFVLFHGDITVDKVECIASESDHPFVLATLRIHQVQVAQPSPRQQCLIACSKADSDCMAKAHSVSDRQGCVRDTKECKADCK